MESISMIRLHVGLFNSELMTDIKFIIDSLAKYKLICIIESTYANGERHVYRVSQIRCVLRKRMANANIYINVCEKGDSNQ